MIVNAALLIAFLHVYPLRIAGNQHLTFALSLFRAKTTLIC